MRTYGLILLLMMVSLPLLAKNDLMNPVLMEDGVFFESFESHGASTLSLRGPGTFQTKMNFAQGESPFIDITNVGGKGLADGLYKYEIAIAPATIQRGGLESNQSIRLSSDRNAFNGMTDPKKSPISGTFRIQDGALVDSSLAE